MKISNKLNELKPTDLNCNVFDVYNYDGLSMQELLCQFFTKINECITVSNETIDLASWLVNEGLKIEVVNKLMLWLNDGTLENLINVNLFNTLNTKIENINTQLTQIENNIVIITPSMSISEINTKLSQQHGTYLFKKGLYNFYNDDKIIVKSNSHLIFEKGSYLKQCTLTNTHYDMIRIRNIENVVIDNVVILGERDDHVGTDGEWGYGIAIYNSHNITINNAYIEKTWGGRYLYRVPL